MRKFLCCLLVLLAGTTSQASITFTGQKAFTTTTNNIWQNQTQASQFYLLRVESVTGNIASDTGYFDRVQFGFRNGLNPVSTTQVQLWTRVYGTINGVDSTFEARTNVTVGVTYPVCIVWDGATSTRRMWLAGVPIDLPTWPASTGPGVTTASRIDPVSIGLEIPNPNVVITLSKLATWNGYVLSSADITALTNNADPSTIGTTATARNYWSLAGTTGAPATLGDPGLQDKFGGKPFVATAGTGTAVYTADLAWTPTVQSTPYVASSGKIIAVTFQSLINQTQTIPSQILATPTLTVNGTNLGSLGTQWLTGYHPVVLFATPGNYQIKCSDVVQLTAPSAWANTPAGSVAALTNTRIDNRCGRSSLETELVPKQLRIGMNNSQAPYTTNLGFYTPLKNWKYKVTWPPGSTGKLASPPWSLVMNANGMTNGIDDAKYPGMAGLWLVMWDAATTTATLPIPDAGFEAPVLGTGIFQYRTTGSPWTFTGNSGISGNTSGFTASNPVAPEGAQVGLLQSANATISQVIPNWQAGNYTLSFQAAQRNYLAAAEDFQILIDTTVVRTCKPTSTAYQSYTTNPFPVTAGSHTLTLQGLNTAGGDNTVFLDKLALQYTGTAPNTVTFGIATDTGATVTERVDLRVSQSVGNVRVFDVQPTTSNISKYFTTSLSYADSAWAGTPNYSNLWVCQPGDFDIVNGQVVLDRTDPWALSRIYLDRIGNGVGSMRWVDSSVCGGNPVSVPYPELFPKPTNEGWGELAGYRKVVGYTAAGPVDPAVTPYLYSPFFKQAGQSFPTTLGTAVTTTPAVNTKETWTFTDGATAPLMAGLEVMLDQEIVRIIGGSDTNWVVNRGSNGTTPAPHAAGVFQVSGRQPITINAQGLASGCSITQFTTSTPHGCTTGNGIGFNGTWPAIAYTDGASTNWGGFGRFMYITGPNTFYMVMNSTASGGSKPTQVYTLDPAQQNWDYRYGGQIPVEVTAIITGKFPKANLHINVPMDCVDDAVWQMARAVRDNFPAGRKVYVEYCNEPWNWAFSPFTYHVGIMGPLRVPGNPCQLADYAYRAGQVHQIFRQVFTAAGRGSEVMGLVNCQMGSGASQVTPYLNLGLAQGTPFDSVAVAPYYSMEGTAYNQKIAAQWDDEQLIDMLVHDLRYNPSTMNAWMQDVKNAVDTYNKANSKTVSLICYEGSIEFVDPRISGVANIPYAEQRSRDCQYNPNWYFAEQDYLAWVQSFGIRYMNLYAHAMWWGPAGWGGYHTSQQRHSRGDGSAGSVNNRLHKSNPTSPFYIGPGVGLDGSVDAVRPQAWLDWLTAVGNN